MREFRVFVWVVGVWLGVFVVFRVGFGVLI